MYGWGFDSLLLERSELLLKSVKKVALGGMIAALSIVLMMLTGLIPMAEFALPALAGVLFIVLVIEISPRWAFLVYIAVAILSLLLAPSKDSAVFFTTFLGWYPIVKSKLESIRKPVLEWVWKMLIFNFSIGVGLAAAIFLFRLDDYMGILQSSAWVLILGWIFLNGVFVIYDIALTRLITAYIRWFRPKYLQKIMGKFS